MNILEDLKSYKKEIIIGPLLKLIEAIIEVLLPITIAKLIDNAGDFDNKRILIYGIRTSLSNNYWIFLYMY